MVSVHAGWQHALALTWDGQITAWGDNGAGQLNVPPIKNPAVAVSAGGQHSLAVLSSGTIIAWGDNSAGQCVVPDGFQQVRAIAAGGFHSLALDSHGAILGWGDNQFGQLDAPAVAPPATMLSAGGYFSLALLANGRVTGWGFNGSGQTDVPPAVTNARSISAGFHHALALLSNGTVIAWGRNNEGQCNVPIGVSNVTAIAAGRDCSLALTVGGRVVGWGNDVAGQGGPPATMTNLSGIAAGDGFNVGVTAAPVLRSPPTDQLLVVGSTTVFQVVAVSETPVMYQWLRNGTFLPGATESSFIISNTQPSDTGAYTVIVSNPHGSVSVSAMLAPAPGFLVAPSSRIGQRGQPVTFTTMATSSIPVAFQWKFNGTDIAGATSATLVHSNAQPANVGAYQVVMTSTLGSVTSAPAWLSLVSSNVPARVADTLSLSITSPLPYTFQWRFGDTTLPGQTGAVLTLSNVQSGQSGNYRVVASDGTNLLASPDVAVTVFLPPVVTNPPSSQTVGLGASATFSVATSGTPPFSYQWFFNNVGMNGATNAVMVVTNLQPASVGNYKVAVRNFAGATTSAVATVTLGYPPGLVEGPASLAVPVGTNANFQAAASGTEPFFFQWRINGAVLPSATNPTVTLTNVQLGDNGSVVAVVSNLFGAITSPPASLIVTSSPPHFLIGPATRIVWNGETATFEGVPRGDAPLVLQWFKDGVALAAATNASLTVMNASAADEGRYALRASNSFGVSLSSSARLRVLRVAPPSTVLAWDGAVVPTTIPTPVDLCGVVAIDSGMNYRTALLSDHTVRTWGALGEPPGLTNVVAVASGRFHVAALQSDGKVVAWGANGNYQTNVPADLKPAIAISAGPGGSSAVLEDGSVRCWGTAATVPPILTNALTISSGAGFDVVLNADGTVTAWGQNESGQTNVPPGLNAVMAISAGEGHSLALRSNGTVVAWGNNDSGATVVPPGLTGVTAIAAGGCYCGFSRSYALKADGTAVAWGRDWFGQPFPPQFTNLTSIMAGDLSGLALQQASPTFLASPASLTTNAGADVTLSCVVTGAAIRFSWLFNQMPIAGATNPSVLLTNVQAGHAGRYQLMVITCTGAITSAPAALSVLSAGPVVLNPVQRKTRRVGSEVAFRVVPRGTEPFAYQWSFGGLPIPGANNATLALSSLQSSQAGAYGILVSNAQGTAQTIYELTVLPPDPMGVILNWGSAYMAPPPGLSGVASVSSGAGSSAVRKVDGTVFGWGLGGLMNVPAGLSNVIEVTQGARHVLALRSDGTLVAWGDNYNGQSTIPAGLEDVEAIAAGDSFNVVARADGSVVVWGNSYGNVRSIPATATNVFRVAAGSAHVLALRRDGTVIGWGINAPSQAALNLVTGGVALAAAHINTLILRDDGTVRALGGGPGVPQNLTGVAAIATGYERSYAVLSNGTIVGWGQNTWGQTNPPPGSTNIVAVAASSEDFSLALKNVGVFIRRQPMGITVPASSNVTLTVEATGVSPLTYQWRFQGTNLPGASNPTLILANVQDFDAGDYSALVTSSMGEVLSAPATLTVLAPPRIVVQPASQVIPDGSNATFYVQAAGSAPFSYQWQVNGTNLAGRTSSNLVLTAVRSLATNSYRVRITNAYGAVTSAPALLTVLTRPTVLSSPGARDVVVGSNTTFTVTATGTQPLAYQWQSNGVDIPAATDAVFLLSNAQLADSGSYRVVVTNVVGITSSAPALLTVRPLTPTILVPPTNRTVSVGSTLTMSVVVTGAAPFSYHWRREGASLPGANASVLPLSQVQGRNAGLYDVVVANSFGAVLRRSAS